MSTIDPSIPLGVRPPQIESPMNAMLQLTQMQGAQQQNALLGLKMQELERARTDDLAMRAALAEPGADPAKVLLGRGKVTESLAYTKGQRENDKAKVDLVDAKLKQSRAFLDTVQTPEQYLEWHKANHADPVLGPELAARGATPEKSLASIQQALQTPGGFQDLLRKSALGLEKFTELNKPTTTVVNAGGTSQVLQTPGLGGAPQAVGNIQHTATPGEILTDTRTRSEGALNRGAAAARQQETIAAENLRAGVTPGGGLDDNAERTAQAIASGQLSAPSGMALLNPKNQRILGRVMEINPQYDATTVAAKAKAARDFTSGTLGNSMRSFQVAGQHLEQLGKLVDAMGNGNMQLVNKLANAYSQQTGNPAVTNFEAAKEIVGKEVVKAIVAGGGGVSEREELSRLLGNAKSAKQLHGVITQFSGLMAAQHEALLAQRRAAGLPDSTLPKYTEGGGGGATGTEGWSIIGVQPAKK